MATDRVSNCEDRLMRALDFENKLLSKVVETNRSAMRHMKFFHRIEFLNQKVSKRRLIDVKDAEKMKEQFAQIKDLAENCYKLLSSQLIVGHLIPLVTILVSMSARIWFIADYFATRSEQVQSLPPPNVATSGAEDLGTKVERKDPKKQKRFKLAKLLVKLLKKVKRKNQFEERDQIRFPRIVRMASRLLPSIPSLETDLDQWDKLKVSQKKRIAIAYIKCAFRTNPDLRLWLKNK